MSGITHLLLFIHPPVTRSYHNLLDPAPEIAANCRRAMAAASVTPRQVGTRVMYAIEV